MDKNLKMFTDNIEQEALDQINTLLEQEVFKDSKVRIMPDVHAGNGCVIGFTAEMGDKVVPNLVGSDIGCNMYCMSLAQKDFYLKGLDSVIRENIYTGKNVGNTPRFKEIIDLLKCRPFLHDVNRLYCSMGSLGGGNHFIELDRSNDGNCYLIVHTGSRNLGAQVAKHYQKLATEWCSYKKTQDKEICDCITFLKENGREREIEKQILKIRNKYKGVELPSNLCYLEGQLAKDYIHDMKLCTLWAKENSSFIGKTITYKMNWAVNYDFHTVHNYIGDDNIVRKGAISAMNGEMVLIPMNMRDGCIIGLGKGNSDWNFSAPHGAGRIMSRTESKNKITMESFRDSMSDIFTTSINENTLDEAPMAYKPMEEIINCIGDTVDIVDIVKPIYNFKDSGS